MESNLVMTIFIALVGPLSVLAGAWLNHFLEKDRRKQELLFVTKKEVYAKLGGYARNFIVTECNSENEMKLQRVLSEAILISNESLTQEIRDFANAVDEFSKNKRANTLYGNKLVVNKLKVLEKKLKAELHF